MSFPILTTQCLRKATNSPNLVVNKSWYLYNLSMGRLLEGDPLEVECCLLIQLQAAGTGSDCASSHFAYNLWDLPPYSLIWHYTFIRHSSTSLHSLSSWSSIDGESLCLGLCSCSSDGVETLELSEHTVNPGEPKTGPYDFELLKLLGKGGYGKVRLLRGFAKLKKFRKSKQKLDRAHPTHPPPIQTCFFGNPSLTWTEHSNYNNQQLLALYTDKIHNVYWFRATLGQFSKKKKKIRVRP